MRYIKPSFEKEAVETEDIILASVVDLGNGVTLTETAEGNAKVSASVFDVLGLR